MGDSIKTISVTLKIRIPTAHVSDISDPHRFGGRKYSTNPDFSHSRTSPGWRLILAARFDILRHDASNVLHSPCPQLSVICDTMPDLTHIIEQVRRNLLFTDIGEEIVKNISQDLEVCDVQSGQQIFDEGEEGDCLYLIVSGCVRVSKLLHGKNDILLGELGPGEYFGELDLIDHRLRSARVTASTETQLLRLGKAQFGKLLAYPEFLLNLLRMLSLRLRSSDIVYANREESNLRTLQIQLDKLHKLIEATKSVNTSLEIDTLLGLILRTALETVHADRGTVYLIDEHTGELWSRVVEGSGSVEIRLPLGRGIAGLVGATGKTINITDAYRDPRFNPEIDRATGYRTTTILCMPMRNKEQKVIGVIQLLNKYEGIFSKDDEEFLDGLSLHASIAIENARLAQTMIQNERLSAVGRMAGTIIHDIKNPMSVLRLSAQLMKQHAATKSLKQVADEMIVQIDRFVMMAQEILDFSRGVSDLKIESISFPSFVETIFSFLEKDLERRNITLVSAIEYKGKVSFDPDKIMRVFYNIVGNAADAMPEGGTIAISAYQRDAGLEIAFKDSGVGMPPEIRSRIFEPFVSHGKRHGTGLGMAIAKKIIDDHHGVIEVMSEVGKGTTILVRLPLSTAMR